MFSFSISLILQNNFELNRWSEVSPMSLMRSRVALVANLGRLWAIGGYDGASNLSTVEVYDPLKNTWKNAPPMCAHEVY